MKNQSITHFWDNFISKAKSYGVKPTQTVANLLQKANIIEANS